MSRAVLAVGIDPKLLANAGSSVGGLPPVDAAAIRSGAAASQARLAELGFEVDICFLDYGATAAEVFRATLAARRYDFVMIGAGLRMDPELTHLFEVLVNATVQLAPGAILVFNTDPASSAAAIERWYPQPVEPTDAAPGRRPSD